MTALSNDDIAQVHVKIKLIILLVKELKMIISKISKQKKNQHRYNIFTKKNGEDVYLFSVHEDLLIRFNLRKGLELTEEEIKNIQEQEAIYKYYTQAINYLSYRMRSIEEVKRYLKEKEATEEEITYIIEKLLNEKLLDDLEFSLAYVRTKINTSINGPAKIRNELIQKGVAESIIEEALHIFTDELQIEKLVKFIEKKSGQSRRKSYKEETMLLKRSLLQKGYSQEIIETAFQQAHFEKEEDQELEALRYQGEKIWTKYSRKYEGFTLIQKTKGALYQKGFSMELINTFIDEKREQLEESF